MPLTTPIAKREREHLGPEAIGVASQPGSRVRSPADAEEQRGPSPAPMVIVGNRMWKRDVGGELHSRHQQGIHRFSAPRRANRASSTWSPSCLRSAHGAGGDNRPMIRYVVDVGATHRHTFSVELRIEHPDPAQRLSLPAWIPGSYLVREFARHLSALTARAGRRGAAAAAARQGDLAGRLRRRRSPLVVRYEVYAFDTSVRAALLDADARLLQRHRRCACASRAAKREPHALELRRPARRLGGRDGARAASTVGERGHGISSPPTTTSWSTTRSSWAASGAAASTPPACRTSSSSPARCPTSTASGCSPTRSASARREIALLARQRAAPPFERYLFLLNAVDDGHGGLEHRASTALIAPRRDLPRASATAAAGGKVETSDGYVDAARPDQPRVLPRLERQAAEAARSSRPTTTRGENYTELLWFFEGFTSYYDDLFLLRAGLIDAARYLKLLATTINACGSRRAGACRAWPTPASTPGSSTTAPTRTRRTPPSATTPRARWSRSRFDLTLRGEGKGSLDDVMRALWHEERRRPDRRGRHRRRARGGRRPLVRRASSPPGCTAPTSCRCRRCSQRFGVEVEAQPATLAQRLGIRVSESALTGVKVTPRAARRRRRARRAVAPGDELIAVDGWRCAASTTRCACCAPDGDDDAPRRPRPARADACRRDRLARRRGRRRRPAQAGREGRRRGASPLRGMDRRLNARRRRAAPAIASASRRLDRACCSWSCVAAPSSRRASWPSAWPSSIAPSAMPKRIEVAYVRTIEPEAPPVARAPRRAARRKPRATRRRARPRPPRRRRRRRGRRAQHRPPDAAPARRAPKRWRQRPRRVERRVPVAAASDSASRQRPRRRVAAAASAARGSRSPAAAAASGGAGARALRVAGVDARQLRPHRQLPRRGERQRAGRVDPRRRPLPGATSTSSSARSSRRSSRGA